MDFLFRVETAAGEPTLGQDLDLDCDCPRVVGLDWMPLGPVGVGGTGRAVPVMFLAGQAKVIPTLMAGQELGLMRCGWFGASPYAGSGSPAQFRKVSRDSRTWMLRQQWGHSGSEAPACDIRVTGNLQQVAPYLALVHSLDLASSDAKIDRAFEHLETLETDVRAAWAESGPYSVRFSEVDPETGWCEVSLVPAPEIPRFGVIMGDLMHNLRSALDYIVTALVDATDGVTLSRHHQFPIFSNPADYLAKVGDPAAAPAVFGPLRHLVLGTGLIEQLQPYKANPDPREDPMWHIHRFSNADKHRKITTLLAIPLGSFDIAFEGTVFERDHIVEITDWKPYEEAVIERLRFDPPIARNLRVTGPMTVNYAFSTPAFGPEGEHGIHGQLLRKCCDHVRMVVDMFKLL